MSQNASKVIECPVSWWFHKRVLIFVVVIGGFAAYFVYDGYIGYPKDNQWVDEYEAFDPDVAGTSWGRYAAKRNRPAAAPERHTAAEILQQKQIGFGGLIAVAIGGLWWWRKNQKKWLIFLGDKVVTPKGQEISFEQVKSINLAKWSYGIAYLHSENLGRVRVDDFVYQGLDQLIDCLREARPDLGVPRMEEVYQTRDQESSESS